MTNKVSKDLSLRHKMPSQKQMLKKTINTNRILCLRQISKIRFNVPSQYGEQQNEKKMNLNLALLLTNFIHDHSCC
jgi:hypothetical protein